MKNTKIVLSILVAGILGASLLGSLSVGLVRADDGDRPLRADHSTFDTQAGDKSVTCSSNRAFFYSAAFSNFNGAEQSFTINFITTATGAVSDLVSYLVQPHTSLTVSGYGAGTNPPGDDSGAIKVTVSGPASGDVNPMVGWVSIMTQGSVNNANGFGCTVQHATP